MDENLEEKLGRVRAESWEAAYKKALRIAESDRSCCYWRDKDWDISEAHWMAADKVFIPKKRIRRDAKEGIQIELEGLDQGEFFLSSEMR